MLTVKQKELCSGSIVRTNLFTHKDYSPYCGKEKCCYSWPRTTWSNSMRQFYCKCGWCSEFPSEFIQEYLKVKQELK